MKSIRISDELYQQVQGEALLMSRSIAQQLEHWSLLGRQLEHHLSREEVHALLRERTQIGLPATTAPPLEISLQLALKHWQEATESLPVRLRQAFARLLKRHTALTYSQFQQLPPRERVQLVQTLLRSEWPTTGHVTAVPV